MKKIKLLALSIGLAAIFSSCTIMHDVQITDNPVGTKVGIAKTTYFGNGDSAVKSAAKNGSITKIATVEVKTKTFLGFMQTTTTVTGE